jgi:hypothetical protein
LLVLRGVRARMRASEVESMPSKEGERRGNGLAP